MKKSVKTAIVTGGAGFLGSHLCEALLENGYKVICVDSLLTGSLQNILHLKKNNNFIFRKHDIIKPLKISGSVNEIYNFACPASPPQYQADPIHTWKTSVYGVHNMLELARSKKALFLQASTSEVYGDPEVHPQVESYRGSVNPIGPRACYDEGKRAAESLCFDYIRTYKMPIKVVRIFNTYGPRMDANDGRVVSNFIVSALKNKSIEMYGDGSQTRGFCYVSDMVVGILAMMRSRVGFHGPVNLGNSGEFNLQELAGKIVSKIGLKKPLVYKSLPIDDPKRRCPDISLAKKELNWEPVVGLDAGLDLTIGYFRGAVK